MSFGGDTSKTSGANEVGIQRGPTESALELRHLTESWRPYRAGLRPCFTGETWGWTLGTDAAAGDVFCIAKRVESGLLVWSKTSESNEKQLRSSI